MHPACPNKEQNHLQNSLLRRTQSQFWVRKTFSKPASLKRALECASCVCLVPGSWCELRLTVVLLSPRCAIWTATAFSHGRPRYPEPGERKRSWFSGIHEVDRHQDCRNVEKETKSQMRKMVVTSFPSQRSGCHQCRLLTLVVGELVQKKSLDFRSGFKNYVLGFP